MKFKFVERAIFDMTYEFTVDADNLEEALRKAELVKWDAVKIREETKRMSPLIVEIYQDGMLVYEVGVDIDGTNYVKDKN